MPHTEQAMLDHEINAEVKNGHCNLRGITSNKKNANVKACQGLDLPPAIFLAP